MKGRERVRRNRGNAREMALHSDPTAGGGGGAKRPRSDAQGAAEASPISALPDELRQRVLTLLPLKDAIRTGVLARGWRGLWRTRWAHRSAVEVHLGSRDAPERELGSFSRAPSSRSAASNASPSPWIPASSRPRTSGASSTTPPSAAVEPTPLHRFGISSIYKGAQTLHALEVIELYCISTTQSAFKKMMALIPVFHLRTNNLLM